MTTLNILLTIGVFTIVVMLAIVVAFPDEVRKAKRKRKKKKEPEPKCSPANDDTTLRLEQHINRLKQQIQDLENAQKRTAKEIAVEQVKNRKLQEKLKREQEWREREKDSTEKKSQDFKALKDNLQKLQQDFDKEYSARLRLEREHCELKASYEKLDQEKRRLTLKIVSLESELDGSKKEVLRLKRENQQLVRESEEKNWIAKSEYDRLERELKKKDEEIHRLKGGEPPSGGSPSR